jgi:hypothetical protein
MDKIFLRGLLINMVIYTIAFASYLELSPQIGNVWYRMGADGIRHIRPENLLAFMVKPLSMVELWYPHNWDINYFAGLAIIGILYSSYIIYIRTVVSES